MNDTPVADGRDLTVQGLEDPFGDDPNGNAEFLAFGDGESYQQEQMSAHRPKYGGGSMRAGSAVPVTPSGWLQAAAMSLTSTSPHDVRGPLLMLMQWQKHSEARTCHDYGVRYLTIWCGRVKQRPRREVIEAAVADALALVYWGRERHGGKRLHLPTVEQRRVELKVDKGRYAMYRSLMESVYSLRLREARLRFRIITHHRPTRNTDYRARGIKNSSLWIKSHAAPGPVILINVGS